MEKIFSKINPERLLHVIVRKEDFKPGRQDLIGADQFIQCSALQLNKGTTFKPHKHKFKAIDQVFPQESWHVLEGRVKCIFYDFDDTIIAEPILEAGDTSFSLFGGHNYELLEDGKILEYKVGPYWGQEADKKFID